jgi:hypothetical protein
MWRCGGGLEKPTLLGPLERANPNHWTQQTHHQSCFIHSVRDSSVGIATGYLLDGELSEFEFLKGQDSSLLHVVQTGSGAHPAPSSKVTGGSFLEGKAA